MWALVNYKHIYTYDDRMSMHSRTRNVWRMYVFVYLELNESINRIERMYK